MRHDIGKEKPRDTSGNSPADSRDHSAEEQGRAAARMAMEDYLDHVSLPLVETLTYAERCEMRQEVAQHLQALADAFAEIGDPPALAMQKALTKFGPPEMVARLWKPAVRSTPLRRGQRVQRWLRRQWPGMAATLTACSLVALAFAVLRPTPITSLSSAQSERVSEQSSAQCTVFVPTFRHAVAARQVACTVCHRSTPRAETKVFWDRKSARIMIPTEREQNEASPKAVFLRLDVQSLPDSR